MNSKTSDFIQKSILRHGDSKFTYELTDYITAKHKITLTCAEHGNFTTSVQTHLYGNGGCPACATRATAQAKILSAEQLKDKAAPIHGDTYTYTNNRHPDNVHLIEIICKKHGPFYQRAASHLQGSGCKKCGIERRADIRRGSTSRFLKRAREVHGDRYNYKFVEYTGCQDKVKVVCDKHGVFLITPNDHIRGKGCKKCANAKHSISVEQYKKRLSESCNSLGVQYSIVDETYVAQRHPVDVTCPEHGLFTVSSARLLLGRVSCPKCTTTTGQQKIISWLDKHGIEYLVNDYTLLLKQQVDILIPQAKLALEFNGIYWHSTLKRPNRRYHLEKTLACEAQGYDLIHIWEDQWEDDKEFSKILQLLSSRVLDSRRVGARKCQVKEILKDTYSNFCSKYHLLGTASASIHLGLYFKGELIAVVGCVARKNETLLVRYTVKHGTTVAGGLAKLLKTVSRPIVTYCELSYFSGRSYLLAGFENKTKRLQPDLWYIRPSNCKREFRRKFQKHKLIKLFGEENVDLSLTEKEICANNGWYQLFSCGHRKFVLE